jgi:hypothetical protein
MNPRLKHLEAVVAKARGKGQKTIMVYGGVPGAPTCRMVRGRMELVGMPLHDLQVEDGVVPQSSADACASRRPLHGSNFGMRRPHGYL